MKREKNRKEWIKNVLIIFLVIMLLLTFFSNTIMNYSLAEVSSTYITNGSISTAIRGNGVIQSVDPYSVTISEGRKVESVLVRKGYQVSKGDVMFILEDGESTEVTAAKKNYETLVTSFQRTIIENKISASVVEAAQNHDKAALDEKMKNLEARMDVLKEKEAVVADIDSQIRVLSATIVDTSAEEAQLKAAQEGYKGAQDKLGKYNELQAKIDSIVAAASAAPEEQQSEYIGKLMAVVAERDAIGDKEKLEADIKSYETQIENIQKQIADKKAVPSTTSAELSYKRVVAENERMDAQNSYNELLSEITYQMQLEELLERIADAKENYEKLESKHIGTEVLAPVSGTVTSVNVVAGEKVAAEMPMAVIQLSGKEYTLEMTVNREQAARIRVGDIGKASNSWYYSDMVLTVSAIKPDTSNPSSGNRIVVFTVTGSDIMAGQSVTVSVGDRSANYDMIVPNTAIREDKNGTYILIISSKNTPLGNRYTATRVDVTKLASDDTNTAISCGLSGYESVITTATKPVSSGDLVRLPK